jgi:CRISPR-associated endoribonuclease Cas6
MPSRWEVALAGPTHAAIPLSAPLAVVSGWLDDARPAAAETGPERASRSGHGDQARKWACGPLRTAPPGSADGADAVTSIQVRLLDDSLSDRLKAATQPAQAVRLGRHEYRIAEGARLAERASWPELRRWSRARAWQIRFLTPACVRRSNRTSPWVSPESLARGLAERWHRLDPATAPPLPGPGASPVWVSDIDGRSEVHMLTRNVRRNDRFQQEDEVISGFVGRVRYVCDRGSAADAADFDALMAFAAFAGVGSHTTCGFGVVIPEPTWQPPTTQVGQP